MAYIYKHTRTDKNEVFYIGIGDSKNYQRAYDRSHRNRHWKSIINKTDYIVEIIQDNLSWEEARKKEIELIKEYGRKDLNEGTLVNMTDGGDGTLGFSMSYDTKLKLSNANSGSGNGNWKKQYTKEEREKLSISQKKRFQDPKERLKTNVFKNLTEEQLKERKKVWSECKKGKSNGRFKWDIPVLQINPNTNKVIKEYEYPRLVQEDGFASKYVIDCCNGKTKYGKYKGFIWSWKKNKFYGRKRK